MEASLDIKDMIDLEDMSDGHHTVKYPLIDVSTFCMRLSVTSCQLNGKAMQASAEFLQS